jgi:hypothetical protein
MSVSDTQLSVVFWLVGRYTKHGDYALDLFRSTYLRRSAARKPHDQCQMRSMQTNLETAQGDVKDAMHLGALG